MLALGHTVPGDIDAKFLDRDSFAMWVQPNYVVLDTTEERAAVERIKLANGGRETDNRALRFECRP